MESIELKFCFLIYIFGIMFLAYLLLFYCIGNWTLGSAWVSGVNIGYGNWISVRIFGISNWIRDRHWGIPTGFGTNIGQSYRIPW